MKLGVFDSGLGGMLIAKSIRDAFPDLDMMYMGDTMHLPYGNRSAEAIFQFSERCIDHMFKAGCRIIIIACNTASASALRRLQQEYLVKNYPDRRILGVVVPTIEYALEKGYTNLGLIGTNYTISTNIYEDELKKINPAITMSQQKTPLLVPLIEHKGEAWLDEVLRHYIDPLAEKNIEALMLGCTHYVSLKERIKAAYDFDVIAQDDIVPHKLAQYFTNHSDIMDDIGRSGADEFFVTDINDNYIDNAKALYGDDINLQHVSL